VLEKKIEKKKNLFDDNYLENLSKSRKKGEKEPF
jgi:hypothetical protein